jgi:hypothetical protein
LGQGLVEFALALPVLLMFLFVLVELARVLHAWLAIENGARFGIRAAVTGEYAEEFCTSGGGIYDCSTEEGKQKARVATIEAAALAGSSSIIRDESLSDEFAPGYISITVCSNSPGYDLVEPPFPQATYCEKGGTREEFAGNPDELVSVTVDFNHPLITPLLTNVWPHLHLRAKREAVVEAYRTSKVVSLPKGFPTLAPTITPTPSMTPTASNTPTQAPTATSAPPPDCDDFGWKKKIVQHPTQDDRIRFWVRNESEYYNSRLVSFTFWFDSSHEILEAESWSFGSGDTFNPVVKRKETRVVAGLSKSLNMGELIWFEVDFQNEPNYDYEVAAAFTLKFELGDADPITCEISVSNSLTVKMPTPTATQDENAEPTPTPKVKKTDPPENTPRPTKTPKPTKTPRPTSTPKPDW